MAKKPADFESVKDKFKLSLLQIEKRFVDLETVVGELQAAVEELKKEPEGLEILDELPSIKERMEEICLLYTSPSPRD